MDSYILVHGIEITESLGLYNGNRLHYTKGPNACLLCMRILSMISKKNNIWIEDQGGRSEAIQRVFGFLEFIFLDTIPKLIL